MVRTGLLAGGGALALLITAGCTTVNPEFGDDVAGDGTAGSADGVDTNFTASVGEDGSASASSSATGPDTTTGPDDTTDDGTTSISTSASSSVSSEDGPFDTGDFDVSSDGLDSFDTGEVDVDTTDPGDGDGDGDGEIDCLGIDEVCVPVVAGWEGPVAVAVGGAGSTPGCGGNFGTEILSAGFSPSTDGVTCEPCNCDVSFMGCAPSSLNFFDDPNCGGSNGVSVGPLGPGCTSIAPQPGSTHVSFTTGAVQGSCTPRGGGVATRPSPKFNSQIRVCGGADFGDSCGDGANGACVELPSGLTLEEDVCIYRAGDATCPSGFSSKRLVGAGLVDNRSCTACACGSLAGDCSWDVGLYGGSDACNPGAGGVTIPVPGTCVSASDLASGTGSISLTNPGLDPGSACPASGGQPVGDLALDGAITVCCVSP